MHAIGYNRNIIIVIKDMKRGGDTDMRFFDNFLKKIVRKKQVDSQEEEPQEYLSPQ